MAAKEANADVEIPIEFEADATVDGGCVDNKLKLVPDVVDVSISTWSSACIDLGFEIFA